MLYKLYILNIPSEMTEIYTFFGEFYLISFSILVQLEGVYLEAVYLHRSFLPVAMADRQQWRMSFFLTVRWFNLYCIFRRCTFILYCTFDNS